MRKQIKFTQEGIAWTSDHGTKFKNPAGGDLAAHFNGMYGICILLFVLMIEYSIYGRAQNFHSDCPIGI